MTTYDLFRVRVIAAAVTAIFALPGRADASPALDSIPMAGEVRARIAPALERVRRKYRRYGYFRGPLRRPGFGKERAAASFEALPPLAVAQPAPPKNPVAPPPPPPPVTWSDAEIESASAECARIMGGLDIDYEKQAPIREGACGLPYPILVKAFRQKDAPPITLQPPLIMSCPLAAALSKWIIDTVTPVAKARLDAAIVRFANSSTYVCRPWNGNPRQISQHALANALDLGEFVTAKGERVGVDLWDAGDERAAFLHDAHAGACRIFGTILGPEANADHKSHFHLDMTPRTYHLCDFSPGQQRPVKSAAKAPSAGTTEAKPASADPKRP